MHSTIRVGVIGDYDGRTSHVATNEAILNSANYLGVRQETKWISTDALEIGSEQKLKGFDALWCAPGSPYKSAQGAMNAIQFARENNYPFIGTCGGFQHAVLEFARDLLNFPEVKELSFDPYSENHFISSLSCSLAGETRKIYITEGTRTSKIYGRSEANEKYNCSFGLNAEFLNQLTGSGFKVSGLDETGEARILELSENKFFIATLFQPQLSSTPEKPHELILAFLKTLFNNALYDLPGQAGENYCFINLH